MRRGDVFLADLSPVRGSKADKRRPVVLVGNNASLTAVVRHDRGVVTAVPLTSNVRTSGRMHVLVEPTKLNGLMTMSKAQAEQVRSLDHRRLGVRWGRLSAEDLAAVDLALRFHLDLH